MQASIFCLLSDLGPEAGQQSSRLMQTCLSHKKRKQNSYTLGIGVCKVTSPLIEVCEVRLLYSILAVPRNALFRAKTFDVVPGIS